MLSGRIGAAGLGALIGAVLAASGAPSGPVWAGEVALASADSSRNAFGRKHVSARHQSKASRHAGHGARHDAGSRGHVKRGKAHHRSHHAHRAHKHHGHKGHAYKGHGYRKRSHKAHHSGYSRHRSHRHYGKHRSGFSIGLHFGAGYRSGIHTTYHYGYHGKRYGHGYRGKRYSSSCRPYGLYGSLGPTIYAPRYERHEHYYDGHDDRVRIYTHRDFLRGSAPGYKVVPQEDERESMYDVPGSMYSEPGASVGEGWRERLDDRGLVAPEALPSGWVSLAEGRPDRAWRIFAERAEEFPDRAEPKIGYAVSAALLNDLDRAAWALERAMGAADAEEAFASLQRGTRAGRLAERLLNVASKADRVRTSDGRLVAATAYALVGDGAAAREIAEASVQEDQRSGTIRLLRIIGTTGGSSGEGMYEDLGAGPSVPQ